MTVQIQWWYLIILNNEYKNAGFYVSKKKNNPPQHTPTGWTAEATAHWAQALSFFVHYFHSRYEIYLSIFIRLNKISFFFFPPSLLSSKSYVITADFIRLCPNLQIGCLLILSRLKQFPLLFLCAVYRFYFLEDYKLVFIILSFGLGACVWLIRLICWCHLMILCLGFC